MGMPFDTRSSFAEAFKSARQGHQAKQAPELPAGALVVLIRQAGESEGSIINQFTRLVVLLTVGCVRFMHQGRSRIVSADQTYLTMRCSLGKSRTGGARRPFDWIVPRCLQQGVDTLGPLIGFFEELREANPGAKFLIPNIKMRKDGRTVIFDEQAKWDFSSGMKYGKFVELLQGLLLAIGMPRDEVLRASYNTLRRALPSIGEEASFDQAEMQSLSNWTEVVKVNSDSSRTPMRASHPTSRLYAGGKWITAAINRHKAVILVHMIAAALKLDTQAVKWDSIPASCIRQMRGKVSRAEDFALMGHPWAIQISDESVKQALNIELSEQLGKIGKEPESSSSSSEYSSVSNESDLSTDEEADNWPIPYRACEKGKIHLQLHVSDEGVVPYCQDKPFANYMAEDAESLRTSGQWPHICKDCRTKVPSAVAKAIKSKCA